jgi:hypothetical protein
MKIVAVQQLSNLSLARACPDKEKYAISRANLFDWSDELDTDGHQRPPETKC